jgi:hypothetical protein
MTSNRVCSDFCEPDRSLRAIDNVADWKAADPTALLYPDASNITALVAVPADV